MSNEHQFPRYKVNDEIDQSLEVLEPGIWFHGPDKTYEGDGLPGRAFYRDGHDFYGTRGPVVEMAGWVASNCPPDPERLVHACANHEVAIGLVEDDRGEGGGIDPEVYGSTVLGYAHPVSVSSLYFYRHDISIDHLPAPFVCGAELTDLCTRKGGFFGRKLNPFEAATSYDYATMVVSGVVGGYLSEGTIKKAVGKPFITLLGLNDRQVRAREEKVRDLIVAGLERLELL